MTNFQQNDNIYYHKIYIINCCSLNVLMLTKLSQKSDSRTNFENAKFLFRKSQVNINNNKTESIVHKRELCMYAEGILSLLDSYILRIISHSLSPLSPLSLFSFHLSAAISISLFSKHDGIFHGRGTEERSIYLLCYALLTLFKNK